ncbi:MAG: class I SAM-dependent methyltransferase [Acidobacteriota bacterium]|nr:class I SAM-dependent methyltransferase [Acidobacteriota bacterium]
MYHNKRFSGNTPDYWEDNWGQSDFEQAVKFCVIDPLRPLFEKYLFPGAIMFEGGCGLGNYVAYYTARGWRVIGLDFAQKTLKRLREYQPNLPVCVGDVSKLPFGDEVFDLYYSGGVVEHFESGPELALSEARRVLKRNGILLVSVPYLNPLREFLYYFKKDTWRKVKKEEIDLEEIEGKSFFQYVYRPSEFKNALSDAGFEVIETKGYSILWGLYDIPFLQKVLERLATYNTTKSKEILPEKAQSSRVDLEVLVKEQHPSLLKRLVVSEDKTIPLAGTFLS